jgi:hypothetical protein
MIAGLRKTRPKEPGICAADLIALKFNTFCDSLYLIYYYIGHLILNGFYDILLFR